MMLITHCCIIVLHWCIFPDQFLIIGWCKNMVNVAIDIWALLATCWAVLSEGTHCGFSIPNDSPSARHQQLYAGVQGLHFCTMGRSGSALSIFIYVSGFSLNLQRRNSTQWFMHSNISKRYANTCHEVSALCWYLMCWISLIKESPH